MWDVETDPPDRSAHGVPGEQVYLSYAYLNAGDYDAFASLLADDVTVQGPHGTAGRGRDGVIAAETSRQFRYSVEDVWVAGPRIVATGILYTRQAPVRETDFAAIFTLSKSGLISSCRTYVSHISADQAMEVN
ncbi:nuclear transport factor 2 family protein [Streptomyces sp. NPDC002134]|uniref:nuclear transport factor 2 family protein n=1 Tax=Streptomyces sp. NPDC002134 TaxID=3364632 RepID=UPI0036BC7415